MTKSEPVLETACFVGPDIQRRIVKLQVIYTGSPALHQLSYRVDEDVRNTRIVIQSKLN